MGLFRYIMTKQFSKSVDKAIKSHGVVVKGLFFSKNKKEVLLLKNKHGYWDLPGGHIEFGETPEECLLREIKEEIGAKAKVLKLFTIQTVILEDLGNSKISHYISIIFECELFSNVLNCFSFHDDEIESFSWFSVEAILKNKEIKVLNLTKDLLVKRKKIITKKYFIKAGEINSYKEIKYK